MDFLNIIGSIFTISNIIAFISGAIINCIIICTAIIFFLKRERRFFTNLKKKIIIFAPPISSTKDSEKPEDMKMELNLLEKTGFFPNLPEIILRNTSHNNLQSIRQDTLVIVGYNKLFGDESFLKILKKVKELDVPLILFAYSRLKDECLNEIKKYPHHSMCETGLRLVNDVFTTLAIYPYGNK